ncbi:MAG: hypothetical protein Q9160_007211 [Pyrenula sp. 1 TL-2023]
MYFSFAVLAALVLPLTAAPVDVDADIEKRASPIARADYDELSRAAGLSSGAYSACSGRAFDVTITRQINNLATDTQGYIGYSTSRQRITVVLRGSTTVTDILNDINTVPVFNPRLSGVNFPSGTSIIAGVFNPWASVHDTVIAEVRQLIAQYPSYTLESTGHSLGGSLTYLSYIALAQNFPGKSLTSNALAAFPIGNAVFANFGQSQRGLLRRGNNALDGVPNMYATLNHYGTVSFLYLNFKRKDLLTENQEFYNNGIVATSLRCTGQKDLRCSAGNGLMGVTVGHFSSFGGVNLGLEGCS